VRAAPQAKKQEKNSMANDCEKMIKRCRWAKESNPLYLAYHDTEWGVSVKDDKHLFEMLILEGAQAGLSWETILNKRVSYRNIFHDFDPAAVAKMPDAELEAVLANPAIVRNRLKVYAARRNALAFLAIQKEFGSFHAYLLRFTGPGKIRNRWARHEEIPATSAVSDALSRDLKKRGMTFVGSTIVYSFMQATGLVNDHTVDCFRFQPCDVD